MNYNMTVNVVYHQTIENEIKFALVKLPIVNHDALLIGKMSIGDVMDIIKLNFLRRHIELVISCLKLLE